MHSITTMWVENLHHSEINNKVKRGVISGLAAVSGIGFAQAELSQEASATPPTAEQFFSHELARLQSAVETVKQSDNLATVKISDFKTIEANPGVYGKGYTFLGGYLTSIMSEDRSTLTTFGYSFIRTISGSYNFRELSVNIYMGYPVEYSGDLNFPNPNDNSVYSFMLEQHNEGKNLSCIQMYG